MKSIARIAIGILIVVCVVRGCKFLVDDVEAVRKEEAIKNSYREYRETKDGVMYFKTCVEGNEFIATNAGRGTTLAGPIGVCSNDEVKP